MPDIIDGQIDRLLRQAEERFQSGSFLPPTERVRQAPVMNKSIDPAPVYASRGEKLSIRQPQAQPHPAKVGQVRTHSSAHQPAHFSPLPYVISCLARFVPTTPDFGIV